MRGDELAVYAVAHSGESQRVTRRNLFSLPPLTREQEIQKGRLVQRGLSKVLNRGTLSATERNAFRDMVFYNQRLVVGYAKRYLHEGSFFSWEDLLQYGNIGLVKAVRKFDPELGFRFSTYANWWIDQEIKRALTDFSRTIRLPSWFCELAYTVSRHQERFEQFVGHELADWEVAHLTGESIDRVQKLGLYHNEPCSIDRLFFSDDFCGRTLLDVLESEVSTPEELYEETESISILHELLWTLSERERLMVERRFGLSGNDKTLEDVGKHFNVSTEWTRQVVKTALQKLRDRAKERGLQLDDLVNVNV
jgi:RNA polymerase sigma factor (sigma-70 family)